MGQNIYSITENEIKAEDGRTVMHRWETPIMNRMAEFICESKGDIIEFGFGMGIAATAIQSYNVKSHTICEINPGVLKNLHEWAKTRPNVIILGGDWYNNIDKMKTYDGILFDTYYDGNTYKFHETHAKIANKGCKSTWWNNVELEWEELGLTNTEFEIIPVSPPENDYFNFPNFWMPKHIAL